MARWTTEFDCGYETNWWYVIKDKAFDIDALKSKRRYEVNKGNKNFQVRKIQPSKYGEELYKITVAAYETYPAAYRPNIDCRSFCDDAGKWDDFYITYGAFSNDDNVLCGYARLRKENKYMEFTQLKVLPDREKFAINAAIVNKILTDYSEFLSDGGYICDGSRNINHKTAFQDYLEKYFGFRKAYCHLQVQYNPKIKWLVKFLFPIRNVLSAFDEIGFVHSINGVMKMEEICRSDLSGK